MLEPMLITDMTFLFDAPLELAMERLNRGEKDRIEQEGLEFFARVQNAYYQLEHEQPQRIKRIITNQAMSITRETLQFYLDQLLAKYQAGVASD